jgi:hypothetical protein
LITIERLVERWEDGLTALEQIEIEQRGIKTELAGIRSEFQRFNALFEEWLNGEETS